MPEQFDKSQVIGKPIGRTNEAFTRDITINAETRTVESVSLTSETPIYHWFGYIILDHSPESIRLDRFNNGNAPVLWAHDRTAQLGAWSNPRIEDGKLRADAKFSKVGLGAEKYQDVQDGICSSISAGFYMWDLEPELDAKGNQVTEGETLVFRCKDWEPFEASLEPTPADISVGVGRGVEDLENMRPGEIMQKGLQSATERNSTNEERKMKDENANPNPQSPAAPAAAPAVETRSAEDIAADNRLTQAKRVAEWGGVLGADSALVTEYIRSIGDETPTEKGLREYLLAHEKPHTHVEGIDPNAAAERGGAGTESSLALARSAPRHKPITAFVRGNKDETAEAAYRFGSFMLATVLRKHGDFSRSMRFCKEHGLLTPEMTRALSEGVNSKGGYLVPEEFGNDLIDLRLKYGVFRRNAHIVPMSSDTRTDPRRLTGLTATFVNESNLIPESDMTWDRVSLVAKKLATYAVYSSELDEDAVIDIGNTLAEEIAYAFAKKEDECGFIGDGSATYGGIVGILPTLRNLDATIGNIAGIKVGSGNAFSELTLQDFLDAMGLMPDYVDGSGDNAKWYVNKAFYFNVMARLMLAGGGVTAAEIEDRRQQRFLGYPVEFVNVLNKVEGNSVPVGLFGDLSKAATMGVRRDTTISESEHVRFQYDDIVIKGTERFDINVHSVGNASSTAADRQPGPMVALYTAAG